jgi:hypothetical protein
MRMWWMVPAYWEYNEDVVEDVFCAVPSPFTTSLCHRKYHSLTFALTHSFTLRMLTGSTMRMQRMTIYTRGPVMRRSSRMTQASGRS